MAHLSCCLPVPVPGTVTVGLLATQVQMLLNFPPPLLSCELFFLHLHPEMGKAADPADISVLFFPAGANFWHMHAQYISAQVVLSAPVALSAPVVLSAPAVLAASLMRAAPLVLAELENVIIYVVLS